jgi:ankyrin repeat protein
MKNERISQITRQFITTILVFVFGASFAAGLAMPTLDEQLRQAATRGDTAQVRTLPAKGVDINSGDKNGSTALMEAPFEGKADTVELLLAKGAAFDAKTAADSLPLNKDKSEELPWAIARGTLKEIRNLLDSGADTNAKDKYGWTVLMRAVESRRFEAVKLLLDRGADVNLRTECGITALGLAAEKGDLELAGLLLDWGADVNTRNNGGITVLMSSHPEIVKLLLDRGADIDAKDGEGITALEWAARDGNSEIVKLLESRGAKTTLVTAASQGNIQEIRRLISEGADLKAEQGSSALIAAVERGDVENVRLLLDAGVCVNATASGVRALRIAEEKEYKEIKSLLRAHGALDERAFETHEFADKVARRGDELFFRLKDGTIVARKDTPTYLDAAYGYTNSTGDTVVSYKLNDFVDPWYVIHEQYCEGDGFEFINRDTGAVKEVNGAGPFSTDKARFLSLGYPGESPCDTEIWRLSAEGVTREFVLEGSCFYSYRWADRSTLEALSNCGGRGKNDVVIARVKRDGSSWKCSPVDISSPDGVSLCSEESAEPKSETHPKSPAIIEAAESKDLQQVKKLLGKGADVNEKDCGGRTALMYAAKTGATETVKLLLENGADVNAEDKDGLTALASADNAEVAKSLINRGARLTLPIAASLGDVEAIQRFIRQGADVNAKDSQGCEPLLVAWRNKKWGAMKVLLDNGADIIEQVNFGATIVKAAKDGDMEALALMPGKGVDIDQVGGPALIAAAGEVRLDVVRLLIEKGVDINARDKHDRTALMTAAIRKHTEMVKLLLDDGSGINSQDQDGWTALTDGVWGGDHVVVKQLLGKGADVNAKNKYGVTALKVASDRGDDELVKLLKAHGAQK